MQDSSFNVASVHTSVDQPINFLLVQQRNASPIIERSGSRKQIGTSSIDTARVLDNIIQVLTSPSSPSQSGSSFLPRVRRDRLNLLTY